MSNEKEPVFEDDNQKYNSVPGVFDHERKTVLLICQNLQDGIGDFEHFKSHAQDLAILRKKGYKISGCIEITRSLLEEGEEWDTYSKPMEDRAQYVLRNLKEEQSQPVPLFDELFIAENHFSTSGYKSAESNFIEQEEKLYDLCPDIASVFVCGYHTSFFDEMIKRETHAKDTIYHIQYGSGMGLMDGATPNPHGIKLYPERAVANKAQRLLEIGDTDPLFIQHLLNKSSPKTQDCEDYLEQHALLPAYTQTFIGSAAFILTQALRLHEEGVDKTLDFIIPGNAIDEKNIRALIESKLKEIGIKAEDIEFIARDELKEEVSEQAKDDSKIRIISPFITKSQDYKALYHIAEHATGCSGDNSISDSFSSFALPFIQYKPGPIGRFERDQLITTLKHEASQCADPSLQEGLVHLQTYFEVMTCLLDDYAINVGKYSQACRDLNVQKVFNPDYWGEPEGIANAITSEEDFETRKQEIIDKHALNKTEEFADWAQTLAQLASEPSIQKGWEYFRQQLILKYNVRDHFGPLISKNMVERAREQAERLDKDFDEAKYREMLLSTPAGLKLQSLSGIDDCDLDMLLKMTSNPLVVEALAKNRIDSQTLKELPFEKVMAMGALDLEALQPKQVKEEKSKKRQSLLVMSKEQPTTVNEADKQNIPKTPEAKPTKLKTKK